MKNVYIVTEDSTHKVLGVFSSYRHAMIALWSYASNCKITSVEPEYVGVAYNCIDLATNASFRFYVEEMTMNDLPVNDPTL